jgi:hypothetical protein
MWFYFVQFLGLIPSVIAFVALQTGSRKRILICQVICCVLWMIHYGLLGAYTGIAINVVALCRAVVCAFNDKKWASSKLWLAFFLVCFAASPFLTWAGPYCLLFGAAMMLTTGALWTHNMRLTRLLYLCNSPLVLIYNLCARSYSCAIIEVAALISYIIAVWRFDLRRPKKVDGQSN